MLILTTELVRTDHCLELVHLVRIIRSAGSTTLLWEPAIFQILSLHCFCSPTECRELDSVLVAQWWQPSRRSLDTLQNIWLHFFRIQFLSSLRCLIHQPYTPIYVMLFKNVSYAFEGIVVKNQNHIIPFSTKVLDFVVVFKETKSM